MFKYARKNINKWLNNDIQLHFIMKQCSVTQWRVLCPHGHLLKTTTTTDDIRELFSYPACRHSACALSFGARGV